LLQASWQVRVIAVCAFAVLGADVAAVVNGLAPETAEAATPAAVAAAEGTDDVTQTSATALPGSPVVIVGADGTTTQVDPSTPEGQAAIAAATERGDTLLTVVPDEDGNLSLVPTTPDAISDAVAAANDLVPGVTVPVNSDIVDAVQGLIDADPDVIADQVDAIVAATSTTIAAGGATPTTAPAGGDGPALPRPEVTIPDITVTLPPVTVSVPPVTVPLVSTTITVPITVTLPPVSVTVTIPPVLTTTSTTNPPTSITIPVVTTVSSIVQSVLTTLPVTVPTVTIPPITLPHL
jgi:hypothetical protein